MKILQENTRLDHRTMLRMLCIETDGCMVSADLQKICVVSRLISTSSYPRLSDGSLDPPRRPRIGDGGGERGIDGMIRWYYWTAGRGMLLLMSLSGVCRRHLPRYLWQS